MENQAQRLSDLRDLLQTIQLVMKDGVSEQEGAELRREMLGILRKIRAIEDAIESGGESTRVPQGSTITSPAPALASSSQPATPQKQHSIEGTPSSIHHFSGVINPVANSGGDPRFQTPITPNDPFGPAISGLGRRRTLNSMSTSDVTDFEGDYEHHSQQQQPFPPQFPIQNHSIHAVSRETAEELRDPDYHPNGRHSRPVDEPSVPSSPDALDRGPGKNYQTVRKGVTGYGLIVWCNRRMIELHCAVCKGNFSIGSDNKTKVFSSLVGLKQHMRLSHEGVSVGANDDEIVASCTKHALDAEEEEKVWTKDYDLTFRLAETKGRQYGH